MVAGRGHHAVLVALALANPQFAVLAPSMSWMVSAEALGQAQAAAIDELEGNAVAAQADVAQQVVACSRVSTAGRVSSSLVRIWEKIVQSSCPSIPTKKSLAAAAAWRMVLDFQRLTVLTSRK